MANLLCLYRGILSFKVCTCTILLFEFQLQINWSKSGAPTMESSRRRLQDTNWLVSILLPTIYYDSVFRSSCSFLVWWCLGNLGCGLVEWWQVVSQCFRWQNAQSVGRGTGARYTWHSPSYFPAQVCNALIILSGQVCEDVKGTQQLRVLLQLQSTVQPHRFWLSKWPVSSCCKFQHPSFLL